MSGNLHRVGYDALEAGEAMSVGTQDAFKAMELSFSSMRFRFGELPKQTACDNISCHKAGCSLLNSRFVAAPVSSRCLSNPRVCQDVSLED